MLVPITLILLTAILHISLNKFLQKNLTRAKNYLEEIKGRYNSLAQENTRLKHGNSDLSKIAEQNIALYDITKDLCKSLEEEKVFINFLDAINRFIDISDCRFLKEKAQLSEYKGYTVMPLQIKSDNVGYLVAKGVKEEDQDKFYILSQQFILGLKRALLYLRVQELAITDSLTGVLSRRYFMERFDEEIKRSGKFGYTFAFLMADLDFFKEYNDRYGHLVGDAILKDLCAIVKENIRQIDLLGRYGGEEFSIILAETDKEEARFAAERIRQAVDERRLRVYDEDLKVTVSIGASVFPLDGKNAHSLIEKADRALYRAKQEGRNRVCIC